MTEKSRYEELEKRFRELERVEAERILFQEALQERERYLAKILNTTVDGFWVLNKSGVISDVNDAYCRISGFSRDELIGKSIGDLDVYESAQERAQRIQRIIDCGYEIFETRHRRKDGSQFPVEVSASYLAESGGRFVCFCRDLTDRKETEKTLRINEEKYRALYDFAPQSYQSLDENGCFLDVNPTWLKTLGYGRDEVIGSCFADFLHPDYKPHFAKNFPAFKKRGYVHGVHFKIRHREGHYRDILFEGCIGFNPDGSFRQTYCVFQDITERIKAEKTLADSENRFKSLYLSMQEGVCLHEVVQDGRGDIVNYRILDVNPVYEKIIGLKGDSVRGKLATEVYQSDEPPYLDLYSQVVKTGKPTSFETYFPPLDKYFSVSVFSPGKNQFATIFEDVTERRRHNETLRRERQRLEFIIEGSGLGTWELDIQTNETVFNETWARMLGFSLEELRPLSYETWEQLLHPDDRKVAVSNLGACIEGRAPRFHCEYRMKHKDGHWVWIVSSGRIMTHDDQGAPAQMFGTNTNITERKMIEEELREAETLLQAALDNSQAGIAIANAPDGQLRYVNEAGLMIPGGTVEELVDGVGVNEYVSAWRMLDFDGTPLEVDAVPLARALIHGEVNSREFIMRRPEGEDRFVWANAAPIRNDRQEIVAAIVIFLDITENRRAEEERKALSAQLAQAQKLESVGRLAGGVAHDFNNMLTVITGNAELLLSSLGPEDSSYGEMLEIQTAAQRSADLTRQLLAFARKQTVARKVLDLNETIESMLNMLNRIIGEDIQLLWKPGDDLSPVNIDPTQVDQMLANLVINARHAIGPGGGTVVIETKCAEFGEVYRDPQADVPAGQYVVLAVTDDGCGMDEEVRANIFEPFFTTKSQEEGTGLGLATVYGAVKQNEGFINVYSEPGQGTTCRIYLPTYRGGLKQPAQQGIQDAPAARGTETILLVEDEPSILELGMKLLGRLGYQVLAAPTPGEAVRLAEECKSGIDLLITDVVMPEMDGRQLAKRLLTIYPDLKRLFMSGYTENVIAHRGVLEEGIHFMPKPFSLEELRRKVREALEA